MPLEEVTEISFPCSDYHANDSDVADMRIESGIFVEPLNDEKDLDKSICNELPKREEISLQPIPSPRLRKRKRNSVLLKQANERIEELTSEITKYKKSFTTKVEEINYLENCLTEKNSHLQSCVKERNSLENTVKEQVKEIKLVKSELMNIYNTQQLGKTEEDCRTDIADPKQDADQEKLIQKLRKDLKKKSCLLKDAQFYISKLEKKRDSKLEINKLKDKIDNLEDEKHLLNKIKKDLQIELEEIQTG